MAANSIVVPLDARIFWACGRRADAVRAVIARNGWGPGNPRPILGDITRAIKAKVV